MESQLITLATTYIYASQYRKAIAVWRRLYTLTDKQAYAERAATCRKLLYWHLVTTED